MDLRDERHDDLAIGATVGLPEIDAVASGLKNAGKKIVSKAKLRKAQRQLDSGGVESLTPVQKDMLGISRDPTPEERLRGVTYVNNGVPSYAVGGAPPLTDGTSVDDSGIKRFIPYIIGVVLLGIIIYLIVKKK